MTARRGASYGTYLMTASLDTTLDANSDVVQFLPSSSAHIPGQSIWQQMRGFPFMLSRDMVICLNISTSQD